ncbi:MAG: hypothetical protein E6G67_02630 [Actinobacteria bacterium]|nr:MAG: hypothetical protein E6G67_02630 [Actinomycetota bacterium]
MVRSMPSLPPALRSRTARRVFNVASILLAAGLTALAGRHFANTGWPLAGADIPLAAAAGILFLAAYAFKAFGWHRLFAPHERPQPLALAVAGGAASVTGMALPGRFDDAVRIAVVRRFPGRCLTTGVGTLCLSLFMLGLLDAAALMPLASTAAFTAGTSWPVRVALGIVALGGLAAAIIIVGLPRFVRSGRLLRFRLARWMSERSTSPGEAWKAWVLILFSWLIRAVAVLFLLGALGVSLSFPMAIAFLVAGAASGALPVAPAGAATQAGAGAGILMASGVTTSQALAFAVAAQVLVMLAGAAVIVFAAVWHGGQRLAVVRAG